MLGMTRTDGSCGIVAEVALNHPWTSQARLLAVSVRNSVNMLLASLLSVTALLLHLSAGCLMIGTDYGPSVLPAGVAVSKDGVTWVRSGQIIEGARDATAAVDVGKILQPNKDWWTFDTCHLYASDVQVRTHANIVLSSRKAAAIVICVAVYRLVIWRSPYTPHTCMHGRCRARSGTAMCSAYICRLAVCRLRQALSIYPQAAQTTFAASLTCLAWLSQVLSNSSVGQGVGVYWMFYSGGDYEPVPVPEGMPGAQPGQTLEGLRKRPGLALSQVRSVRSLGCTALSLR
jgi:hypothetical protein